METHSRICKIYELVCLRIVYRDQYFINSILTIFQKLSITQWLRLQMILRCQPQEFVIRSMELIRCIGYFRCLRMLRLFLWRHRKNSLSVHCTKLLMSENSLLIRTSSAPLSPHHGASTPKERKQWKALDIKPTNRRLFVKLLKVTASHYINNIQRQSSTSAPKKETKHSERLWQSAQYHKQVLF